jgi:endonuclease/exonuclease/phosphatase family metal-dependent hydrolase
VIELAVAAEAAPIPQWGLDHVVNCCPVTSLSIATWNVAYGLGGRNVARRSQMDQICADIWVLTETHDSLTPGPDFISFSSSQRSPSAKVRSGSRWTSIWVRRDFEPEGLRTAGPLRTAACLASTSMGQVVVFGTVLPWLGDKERSSFSDEVTRQSEDWNRLLSAFAGRHLCVAGDFNVNLGGPHYYGSRVGREALGHALRDTGLTPLTTYEYVNQPDVDYGLIDHVAVSRDLAASKHEVRSWSKTRDGIALSDHHGVVVALETAW